LARILLILLPFFLPSTSFAQSAALDAPVNVSAAPAWKQYLVDVKEVIPDAILEMRYYTDYNFIGKRLDGYKAGKCLLTPQAAEALKKVQTDVKQQGYTLKMYDCYRPQQAVNQFVRWAQDLGDTKLKAAFYPNLDKSKLIPEGYIAEQSGHSRGSTLDLTIVPVPIPQQEAYTTERPFHDNSVDMGAPFDLFDPLSNTINGQLTEEQLKNRLLLLVAMDKQGFKNLPEEWWHFTLRNEPYPDTFFNFPIE